MDITFRNPQYGWLLAAILPLVSLWWAWIWHKSRQACDTYMPPEQRIFEQPSRGVQHIFLGLCFLGMMTFAIVGIMHPEREITVQEPVYQHALTVCVFDTSSSIKSEAGYFGEGGRLGAIKQSFMELLSAEEPVANPVEGFKRAFSYISGTPPKERVMEGQRIGMVTFAGLARIIMKPMTRQETLLSNVRLLEPVPAGGDDGTNFPAAIEEALLLYKKEDVVRVMIFFTDGDEEEGRALPVDAVLQKAKAMGVKIFPIVVGHERAPVPGRDNDFSKPGMTLPRRMADVTGGAVFRFDERGKLYGYLKQVFAQVMEASREPVKKRQNLQFWCVFGVITGFVLATLARYLMGGQMPAGMQPPSI